MLKRWLLGTVLAIASCMSLASDELVRSAYPLLDNRFRVDHGADEITLVIHRQLGTAPAIVVRPDGSKLYVHSLPANVEWLDEPSFDIITIAAPMPGPWQIIGNIDKSNQIEILSDLQLEVEDFPHTFYRGERLKIRANLVNYGEKLNLEAFRRNTALRLFMHRRGIRLASMEAITSGTELGQFYDNGTGLDEYPGDGDFTGEVTTDVEPGRYQFFIMARNESFTRMRVQEVRVLHAPLKTTFIKQGENPVLVKLKVDEQQLKLDSVAMTLNILGTGKYSRSYSIKSLENGEASLDLSNIDRTGDYQLQGWLFGTTQQGREIALALHPTSFGIIHESVITTKELVTTAETAASSYSKPPLEDDAEAKQAEKPGSGSLLWLWILLFVLLCLSGLAAVWWFVIRPKRAAAAETEEEGEETKADLNKPEG